MAVQHELAGVICQALTSFFSKMTIQQLPLTEQQSIGIIGDFAEKPRYQGAGSFTESNPTKVPAPLDVLRDSDLQVAGFASGFKRMGGKSGEAVEPSCFELAKTVDYGSAFLSA